MIAAKKFSLWLLALIVLVSGCERFSVQKQLEKYVAEQKENSPLPRKITDKVTLIDIQAGEKELIQIYKIKGNKQKIKESTDELEQQIKTELHRRKNNIQNLIEYQIVMTFVYKHQKSEEELHRFQVKPWEDL